MNRTLTSAMRYREILTGEKLATPLVMLAFFALATCINLNTAAAQTRQTDSSDRKIVMRVEPEYPETLKRLYIGGIVRIKVTVDPSGKVETAELLGGSPILGQSAMRAVKQWRYAQAPSKESVTVLLEFDPHR
jgi:TonB family protein